MANKRKRYYTIPQLIKILLNSTNSYSVFYTFLAFVVAVIFIQQTVLTYSANTEMNITCKAETLVRVSNGNDDAEQTVNTGSVSLTSSDLELLQDGARQIVGIRFQNVRIPKGVKILNASVEFEVDEAQTGDLGFNISGEYTSNSLVFSTVSYNISNRMRTSAKVTFDPVPAGYWSTVDRKVRLPNISAVIQEIVNKEDWSAGNALTIIIHEPRTANKRTVEAYNGESLNAPLLIVQWENGTACEDITPPSRSNGQPTGTLPAGTTQATLSVTTNENAYCKYSTVPNTTYSLMTDAFSSTGGTFHSTLVFRLTNGTNYTFYVRCQDTANNSNADDFPISFFITSPDTTAPSTPTDLIATSISSFQIDLSWASSDDPESGISRYKIYRDNANIGQSAITIFLDAGLTPNITYYYEVSAVNGAGLESPKSLPLLVTTLPLDTTPPPLVVINSPINWSMINGLINVEVNATDDRAIGYVELYKDDIFFANDTTTPYQYTWNTKNDANGLHTLHAIAVDTSGNAAISDKISIIINNTEMNITCKAETLVRVSNGNDDAEQTVNTGSVSLTSSDLELLQDGARQIVGIRFQNVRIPKGVKILNASVEFEVDEAQTGDLGFNISGEYTSNSLVFSTVSYNISNRMRTSAKVTFDPVPAGYWSTVDRKVRLPNISAVIQEIVNKEDWSAGNALTIIIHEPRTANKRTVEAYNGESLNAPLLIVQWENGTACEDITPPSRSNGQPTGTLPAGTTQATLSVTTNEVAICRYSTTSRVSYGSMPNTFSTTGGTSHSTIVLSLSDGNSYNYYVKCQDTSLNNNTDDYIISFSVALPVNLSGGFVFAASGDHGQNKITNASLDVIVAPPAADFYLALGDLSYGVNGSEQSWCDTVKARVGATYPFELVSGNHEERFIGNFAACLPDRMNSTGTYGANYYFDYQGLVRVIMISPASTINGVAYQFTTGNANYTWLSNTIDDARGAGIPWIIVGMHKNCITMGAKSCEIRNDLMNLLILKRVDLILQAHDHTYQRSKQLRHNSTCTAVLAGAYNASCVADDGSDDNYIKGQGPILVIAGAFANGLYTINTTDLEAGYFVKWMGGNIQPTKGLVKYIVNATQISAQYLASAGGTFTDSFTIVS